MDEELLRLWATHGNREAADRLIRAHEGALYAFARRFARNESEAGDIVQETCLRVLQKAAQFQGRSSLRTWMFGIALNVARSRRFRLQKLRALFRPLESGLESGMEHAMNERSEKKRQHEMLAKVDAALADLPRESRVPILLHYYEGFDYEQMAQILRCPAGTVASRLHAARKKLEKRLRGDGVDLAALGSLEMLRQAAVPEPIPVALQQALRALPQKALASTAAIPVTGVGAAMAGGITAVVLLGGAVFLHVEAGRPKPIEFGTSRFSGPAFQAVPASATLDRASSRENPATRCDERVSWDATNSSTPSSNSTSARQAITDPQISQEMPRFSLRIEGSLREAGSGIPEGCTGLDLRAVWPPREHPDTNDRFAVGSWNTDSHGRYAIELSDLAAGVYELAPRWPAEDMGQSGPFALPLRIDLRESVALHHDFLFLDAGSEERVTLLRSYREELVRSLEALWLEEGKSALRLRILDEENSEPWVGVFEGKGQPVDPLVRVFVPAENLLLLGPLSPGEKRIEVLRPGKGITVLPQLSVPEREIVEASVSVMPAEYFLSLEAVDASGSPVAGAKIELRSAELWGAKPFALGVTGLDGRACFDAIPCRVDVRVQRPPTSEGAVACKVFCGQVSGGTTMRVVLE